MAKPRRRVTLSLGRKAEILKEIDEERSHGTIVNQRELARRYGIAQSTLNKMMKEKPSIHRDFVYGPMNSNRKRRRSGKDADIEGSLSQWLNSMSENGRHVDRGLLKEMAEKFATRLGKLNFRPTNGWLSRFTKRSNLEDKNKTANNIKEDEETSEKDFLFVPVKVKKNNNNKVMVLVQLFSGQVFFALFLLFINY